MLVLTDAWKSLGRVADRPAPVLRVPKWSSVLAFRLAIGSGDASPEPIPIKAARQTLYSQDLKLVPRAAPGAEAILRMSPQVCL